jgi:hypothetical protein
MFQMDWRMLAATAVLSLTLGASRTHAQGRSEKREKPDVPKEYRPPAGMCRVWVDGVPPAQQPAPTDCASAVRNKPANGRVIYGEDAARKKSELPVRGFAKPPERKGAPLIPPDLSQADPRVRDAWEAKKITDAQLHGDPPATSAPASSYPGGPLPPAGPGGAAGGYVTPGGVVVPGAVNDPRYFAQAPGVRPPGTGSATCLDRDGDGWCDDLRFGPPTCNDTDRDGRCDDLPEYASRAYPQVLPSMRAVTDVLQGRMSAEIMQWLGTNEFTVRVPDPGRGGVPWRAIFLDQSADLLQVWTDANRDGRADRIEIFRNGQRVKLIQR